VSSKKKDDHRKERVIHTRVPESLDEELRQRAADLGVSVSNLVRNVLSHATSMVEDIVQDSGRLARSARGIGHATASGTSAAAADASTAGPATEPQVLGWQELLLELNAVCDRCNAILPRGSRAALAVHDRPMRARVFLCTDCLARLQEKGADKREKRETETKTKPTKEETK
jgi:hypothetical protein